ncbi:MAG: inorganic diphosphatase [Polyangiales bacterium]
MGLVRLDRLPSHDEEGNVHVVVEAPRGARVKTQWDPELGAMKLGRPLPLGAEYPFDFGFVPGTKAPDGDPLDAMVLHDAATYPGVVIPSILIGAIRVSQRNAKRRRERNDRLLAVPADAPRCGNLRGPRDLPLPTRRELEQFFVTITQFTEKDVEILGFDDARAAARLLRRAIAANA